MKLIKAKVYFTKDETGTHYSGGYPKAWDAEKIPFIVYGDKKNDGKDYRELVVTVPDDLYEIMLKDKQCEAITETEAISTGEKYMPTRERIEDEAKVLLIVSKSIKGDELTVKEKEALDPTKAETGITKTKTFKEINEKYGVKFKT